MKKLSPLEEKHRFCEICGREMQREQTQLPSRFNRQTGDEIEGAKSYWWQCPLWTAESNEHDREVWVP